MGFSLFTFRQSLPRSIWDWLILIFLLLCAVFFLMPIYVMVVTGLKQAQNVSLSTMWNLPAQLSGGGFFEAWRRLYPNLGNSLQLTIPATILSSILGAINGYIFAKWKFRGANTLFAVLVFGMFIPYQSILIPLIRFLDQIKLYGTVWGSCTGACRLRAPDLLVDLSKFLRQHP
jgi:glucose/mannose transport system permease protein